MSGRLTTGVASRLGWALYWVCAGLAVLWIAGFLALNWYAGQEGWQGVTWVAFGLPPLLAYGLGRFLRYVLADE